MVKIKNLYLRNYCGYRDACFDFSQGGGVKPLAMLYGPNGEGKSTVLQAIRRLASPFRFIERDNSLLFRQLTFHTDYDPTYEFFRPAEGKMEAEAVFATDDGDKRVVIEYDPDKIDYQKNIPREGYEVNGLVLNELPRNERFEYAFFVDADNPMNMQKFQINARYAEKFLDIAKAVYGFPCTFEKRVSEYDRVAKENVEFYTDFIITKEDSIRVHFRRMSDGEKKIATMLSMLCNPFYDQAFDIFLIDNIELHVYFKRHPCMIDKLLEHFGEKQIIATTHSAVLVGMRDSERNIDIRPYLQPECLYDVASIKRQSQSKNNANG